MDLSSTHVQFKWLSSWPLEVHSMSLRFNFFISKLEMIMVISQLLWRLNEDNLTVFHTAWHTPNSHCFHLSLLSLFLHFLGIQWLSIFIYCTILSTFTCIGLFHYKKIKWNNLQWSVLILVIFRSTNNLSIMWIWITICFFKEQYFKR